jgi:predicted RNA-binding protein YlqC (UPF0109 family)
MASMMSDLVVYLAKALVDNPDEVRVSEDDSGERVVVRLDVAEGDWGKVIGRGGRIATSMRQLVKVAAVKEDVRAQLEIGD